MKRERKGLVIRTVFNNQGWAGRCINPLNDPKCFKCSEGGLYINKGNPIEEDDQGVCKGEPENYPLNYPANDEAFWCWEQVLCREYFWGNVRGKWRDVFIGMPVYFVYVDENKTLTLWGFSEIARIENNRADYPTIFFKSFEPMPKEKWVEGLTGEEITGENWKQLHYRYLDETHERRLALLTEGKTAILTAKNQTAERLENAGIILKKDIREKLQKIAHAEGREVDDLIREAVAKLIRDRGI